MTQFDFYILNSIQSLRCAPLDSLMTLLSFLGSYAFPWLTAIILMLIFPKTRRHSLVVAAAMLIGLILSGGIIKHLVMRVRPFNDPRGLLTISDLIISPPMDRFSFPSSHSVTSFAAATGIFLWSRRVGLWAIILALLIALSRIYLYVHFPSDIFAGAIIGVICALLAKRLINAVSAGRPPRHDHS